MLVLSFYCGWISTIKSYHAKVDMDTAQCSARQPKVLLNALNYFTTEVILVHRIHSRYIYIYICTHREKKKKEKKKRYRGIYFLISFSLYSSMHTSLSVCVCMYWFYVLLGVHGFKKLFELNSYVKHIIKWEWFWESRKKL